MEIEILNLIQHLRTPFLDEAMRFVTRLGNFSIAWVMLALVLILIPKTRKIGLAVMVALILDSVLCNVILKNIFVRPRPCDVNTAINLLIPRPLGYSFPSGHTSASFAAVSALYFSGENKIWKAALALAILIAFSRMYLYVHYPTDVLGGILVGIFCGYVGNACFDKICKILKKHA
ncbi:phosphatase PAP2 family protein [Ligilactobacillus ruminis]|uniref:phosphatase PAP2 family protein n=1 Tax=Ligilactobacillus ruminis TaxID=1623 RepID=UPI00235FE87C|nr:phosphatase PAP2 family protein [Ligilactobacillus ruminis]WDC79570.1 phosphatase PAP2 family protein [Ligilactobacillus ruminis]WKB70238.1 phosphatase PAP2 family protein [Ligilactobacillus ruminis]